MNNKASVALLFWIGLMFAFAFAILGTWSLMNVLNTYSFAEVSGTAWNMEGALFRTWAFAVPLGALLAVIGALVYGKVSKVFIWILGITYPLIVAPTVMVFGSRYYPGGFYGVGGTFILLCFFSLVWLWMKHEGSLGSKARAGASLKLAGYLFWITASWYLCGDTAKLHLKAFEGASVPSPTESMVFLALGWFFVTLGEYLAVSGAEKGS